VLTVGVVREATTVVSPADSATLVSPLVPDVYASARMIGFIEATCAALMAEHLGPGETSVGVAFQFSHDAATPIGMAVRVRVELVEVDRRRCVFAVEGHDAVDRITVGRHERFVVDREKFLARVQAKSRAVADPAAEG
jgi:fluoroacetyl-CoA thioesterase